ncbi:MAG: hypothetical protein A2583_13550 [Bdellovibrionales bacterium RIFOXYD1_FULL_53_11]|nr:MAG: hypothetical protein A2583_13550 [Bdellovibrionales bacterium RIFOXYD1_FULL_53_11]
MLVLLMGMSDASSAGESFWSFYFYINADPVLSNEGMKTLKQIRKIAARNCRDADFAIIYSIKSKQETKGFQVVKNCEIIDLSRQIASKKLSSASTMSFFLKTSAGMLAPDGRKFLSIWGHGKGWLAKGYLDEGRGEESGNMVEFARETGRRGLFDVLVLDSCLMSSVEVLYEFRAAATYVIASQLVLNDIGIDYSTIDTRTDPLHLSMNVISGTARRLKTSRLLPFSLALVDIGKIEKFRKSFENLLLDMSLALAPVKGGPEDILDEFLGKPGGRITWTSIDDLGRGIYLSSRSGIESMSVDLGALLDRIKTRFPGLPSTDDAIESYGELVVDRRSRTSSQKHTGISIFFPKSAHFVSNEKDIAHYRNKLSFPGSSKWLEFIRWLETRRGFFSAPQSFN